MGINKVQYGNTTLIDLTSDTVTADKLMQGYTAHDRTGALITGTATSGGRVWKDENGYVHLSDDGNLVGVEPLTVTENGTYTAPTGKAYSPVIVDVAGGTSNVVLGKFTTPSASGSYTFSIPYTGKAYSPVIVDVAGGTSNVVLGKFTTPSASGSYTFSIPYTGNGYPISFTAYVSGGIRNNTEDGNQYWYNLLQRKLIAEWHMIKCQTNTEPTWASSGATNECNVTVLYKDSASNSDYYGVTTLKNQAALGGAYQSASGAAQVGALRFKGNSTTISYYVSGGESEYGFLGNTEYAYIAVYSE